MQGESSDTLIERPPTFMHDVASIFERYEAIRHRLPQAVPPEKSKLIGSLIEISDNADAFVFDAFGVLNVGETPIPGAAHRLDQLRQNGFKIRILSNAASYPHDQATKKFNKLGMRVEPHEVITSRDAAIRDLDERVWGCIAADFDHLGDIGKDTIKLSDKSNDYDAVDGFLFLSTEGWTLERQSILRDSLLKRPRPVIIANADIAAPRDHGFSLEPGHFGHLLADSGVTDIRFYGKPFPEVFQMIEQSLPNVPPSRIVMCGDTLHTDILGAAARNWRTVLVERDGMFAGVETNNFLAAAALNPTWRLSRI